MRNVSFPPQEQLPPGQERGQPEPVSPARDGGPGRGVNFVPGGVGLSPAWGPAGGLTSLEPSASSCCDHFGGQRTVPFVWCGQQHSPPEAQGVAANGGGKVKAAETHDKHTR